MKARRSVVLLAALSIAAGVVVPFFGFVSPLLLAVAACMFVVAPPIVVAIAQRRLDLFAPVWAFALGFAILFVVRPIVEIAAGGPGLILSQDPSPTYVSALFVAAFGGWAFMFGYFAPLGGALARHFPQAQVSVDRSAVNRGALTISAIGISLFGAFLATSGGPSALFVLLAGRSDASASALAQSSGYFSTGLLWLASGGVAVLATTEHWRSARGGAGMILVAMALALPFASGARSWTIPVIAALVMLWYLRAGRRPRLVSVVGMLCLAFVLGIAAAGSSRTAAVREQQSVLGAVWASLIDPGRSMSDFLTGGDTAMLPDLAIEIQYVPRVLPFQMGATYVEMLARPIPRAVWPEKPREADNQLMAVIWPQLVGVVGFAFSIFGEPYLNFGLAGVGIVLFLYGVISRVVLEWLYLSNRSPLAWGLLAMWTPFVIIYLRGGFGVDFQRQAMMLLPYIAVLFVAARSHAAKHSRLPSERLVSA